MADERWLIAGLGNPGKNYAGNRHNAGHLVADLLAARMGAGFKRDKSRSQLATGRLAGQPVLLIKPISYMNESGRPVASACVFYKVQPSRVIIVYDELDLPFGTIRLKFGGGDNGHNGAKSVTAALGTREYYRVRIGIGRPPGRIDPAHFVLTDFSAAERQEVPLIIERTADAIETLLGSGLAAAQNQFHAAPA
jgi:peptidyl-tRNA hydrolase, PTH1 family